MRGDFNGSAQHTLFLSKKKWSVNNGSSNKVRGHGYGIQLLSQIEGEAIKNGCTNSHLTSFTYQAADFYKKQGYVVFGELEDYPKGHIPLILRKGKLFKIVERSNYKLLKNGRTTVGLRSFLANFSQMFYAA